MWQISSRPWIFAFGRIRTDKVNDIVSNHAAIELSLTGGMPSFFWGGTMRRLFIWGLLSLVFFAIATWFTAMLTSVGGRSLFDSAMSDQFNDPRLAAFRQDFYIATKASEEAHPPIAMGVAKFSPSSALNLFGAQSGYSTEFLIPANVEGFIFFSTSEDVLGINCHEEKASSFEDIGDVIEDRSKMSQVRVGKFAYQMILTKNRPYSYRITCLRDFDMGTGQTNFTS